MKTANMSSTPPRTINGVTYTFGSDGVSDKTPSSANGSFSEADSAFNAKTTAGVRLRKGPGLSYDTITVLAEGKSERDKHEEQRMVCRDNGFRSEGLRFLRISKRDRHGERG